MSSADPPVREDEGQSGLYSCLLYMKESLRTLYRLPHEIYTFTLKLIAKFGSQYIGCLALVYGLNQGLGEGSQTLIVYI